MPSDLGTVAIETAGDYKVRVGHAADAPYGASAVRGELSIEDLITDAQRLHGVASDG